MKTLIEIRNEAHNLLKQHHLEAEKIHPKLISSLQESDLSDQSLFDNSLIDKYTELEKNIDKSNKYIWLLAQEYFNNIAKDLTYNDVDIGFYSNGEKVSIPIDFSLLEPSIHVSKIYNAVMEFNRYIDFEPFWKHEVSIYIKDYNKYVIIGKNYNPVMYIKNAKDRIESSKNHTLTQKLIIAVKTELQCGYKMHSPKYKTDYNDNKSISTYIDCVVEHKQLEELLKHKSGIYDIVDIIFDNDGTIEVKIQENLNAN